MWKKIALWIVSIVAVLVAWQWELVSYGLMQARGQLHIMLNTRPVEDVIKDPAVPDSAKHKIELIGEIRRFAVDSLGLNSSKNFTTFFDQKSKPLLWVLVGSERYALKPLNFTFPIVGTFPYKGFFNERRLHEADSTLQRTGYDTRINEVSAYSTLGFFKDPILSSMLKRPDGSLAELIIHELTHGTLFVKDNLEYNENLADFVGEYGALRFLAAKYGANSEVYRNYIAAKDFGDRYDAHILRGTRRLDSLYHAFKPSTPVPVKERAKWTLIGEIVATVDTLTDRRTVRSIKRRSLRQTSLPNNAYFVGYLTYRKQQNRFRDEFERQFGGDFPRYLTYLKQTYPSL